MPEEPLTNEVSPNNAYLEILSEIQTNPYSNEVWTKTVALAKAEEEQGKGIESFYTHVPLNELIKIGERLLSTHSRNEQYDILTERCSTGESWYDIILGHVNDKSFAPVVEQLQQIMETGDRKLGRGLDVGTGTGNTLQAISPYFDEVVGIDKLESVLHKTKNAPDFPPNAQAVVGDATNLPFGDNSFDVAVSNGLTHYLSKKQMQQYVCELSRVLTKNGLYFESFPSPVEGNSLPSTEQEYLTSAKALLTCLIDNLVSNLKPGEVTNKWSLRNVVEMFQTQGFNFEYGEENKDGVWWIKFYRTH